MSIGVRHLVVDLRVVILELQQSFCEIVNVLAFVVIAASQIPSPCISVILYFTVCVLGVEFCWTRCADACRCVPLVEAPLVFFCLPERLSSC